RYCPASPASAASALLASPASAAGESAPPESLPGEVSGCCVASLCVPPSAAPAGVSASSPLHAPRAPINIAKAPAPTPGAPTPKDHLMAQAYLKQWRGGKSLTLGTGTTARTRRSTEVDICVGAGAVERVWPPVAGS